jgi:hypothetical protein
MAEMNASFQKRTHGECWCRQSIDPFRLIHHGLVRATWPDTGDRSPAGEAGKPHARVSDCSLDTRQNPHLQARPGAMARNQGNDDDEGLDVISCRQSC